MTYDGPQREAFRKGDGLGRTVLADLRRGDFRTTLRRDMKDLYRFYIDEDRRASLARMNRVKRFFLIVFWLLKSMILKLTPGRRILLLVCFILILYGSVTFNAGRFFFSLHLGFFSFIILLVILMLELKDKLLARDELIAGRAVQLALLPEENPIFPGWEIWMYSRPANDVGGDLVDYLHVNDECLGVMLGDVTGKGLGAALLMAKLQASLRAIVPDCVLLSDLGFRMNEIMFRDGISNRFATLVYIELKPNSGSLRFLNAAHCPIIRIEGQTIEKLDPSSPLLGAFSESTFVEQQIDLRPGGKLVIYSDGLTEACNDQDLFFGDDCLRKLMPELHALSAEASGKRLLAEVERFVGEAPQSDDISLVILRRLD